MTITSVFRPLLCFILCLAPAISSAQETLPAWIESQSSRVRLISSGAAADGEQPTAALEIQLDPGFKTYWKNPGESGVPPLLSTGGSENIAKLELLFPVPKRHEDETGLSNIYEGRVVLPLLITAADPAKPVRLKGLFQFGVCEKLCIAAEAEVDLVLGAKPDAEHALVLKEALALLPVQAGENDQPALFPLMDLKILEPEKRKQRVELRFDGPARAVFAEGPAGWFAEASLVEGSPTGAAAVNLSLYGPRKAITLSPCPVRITLTGKQGAIERLIPLDRCTSQP